MASEEPKTAPVEEAPAADSKPAEANKNGGKKNNGKKGPQRDERPIEEVYDLSKPIPRVSVCVSPLGRAGRLVDFYGSFVPVRKFA